MKLGDYYREHGETDHLHRLEATLTRQPQTTRQLAATANVSPQYARAALEYLHQEHRAQRAQAPLEKAVRGQLWQWVWRHP